MTMDFVGLGSEHLVLWALEGAAQVILRATMLVICFLAIEIRTMRLGGVDHVREAIWTSEC
jgi:hypothetical protein